MYNIRRTRKKT